MKCPHFNFIFKYNAVNAHDTDLESLNGKSFLSCILMEVTLTFWSLLVITFLKLKILILITNGIKNEFKKIIDTDMCLIYTRIRVLINKLLIYSVALFALIISDLFFYYTVKFKPKNIIKTNVYLRFCIKELTFPLLDPFWI